MFLAALLFYCGTYFILHVRTALLVLPGLTHLRIFYSALHKYAHYHYYLRQVGYVIAVVCLSVC